MVLLFNLENEVQLLLTNNCSMLILQLEKALREIRAENAEIKYTADSKLAEANALVTSVEEKSLDLEVKLRAADAKLAEVSRKSSEIERKSQDLETRESAVRRDRLSFVEEYEQGFYLCYIFMFLITTCSLNVLIISI